MRRAVEGVSRWPLTLLLLGLGLSLAACTRVTPDDGFPDLAEIPDTGDVEILTDEEREDLRNYSGETLDPEAPAPEQQLVESAVLDLSGACGGFTRADLEAVALQAEGRLVLVEAVPSSSRVPLDPDHLAELRQGAVLALDCLEAAGLAPEQLSARLVPGPDARNAGLEALLFLSLR